MTGTLRVVNFVSIDGVIQSPLSADEDPSGGFVHGGWVPPSSDDTVDAFMSAATTEAGGLLLGRRTYEILHAAWSGADESVPAVAAMNAMPKHVVSRTAARTELRWAGTELIDGELGAAVEAAKARTEGHLLVLGSGQLVRALAELDLVDEYHLLVFPVLLGAGRRMFGDRSTLAHFRLAATTTTASGVVIASYTRDHSPPHRPTPTESA
ncbi:dihydrofolate reductase family protein [Georgenia sp. Z1344]|uniref:dihydrofolate reductase family protein n=1 Tax=Georgenia sp. Z1344 TaxID=3416706 RepID=UPI003CF64469